MKSDLELRLSEKLDFILKFIFRKYELLKIVFEYEKCWAQSEYTRSKKCQKIENFEKIEIFMV